MKYPPVKMAIKTNWRQKPYFSLGIISAVVRFVPLLSQKWMYFYLFYRNLGRQFGEWIKADFYHVLKFEHRSTIREVGTKDSHQRNVLKCGGKVGTSELF